MRSCECFQQEDSTVPLEGISPLLQPTQILPSPGPQDPVQGVLLCFRLYLSVGLPWRPQCLTVCSPRVCSVLSFCTQNYHRYSWQELSRLLFCYSEFQVQCILLRKFKMREFVLSLLLCRGSTKGFLGLCILCLLVLNLQSLLSFADLIQRNNNTSHLIILLEFWEEECPPVPHYLLFHLVSRKWCLPFLPWLVFDFQLDLRFVALQML